VLWREGESAAIYRGKEEKPREGGDGGGNCEDTRGLSSAYFYVLWRPVCRLPKDEKLIWDTLVDEFSSFFLKKHRWGRDMGQSWRCSVHNFYIS
jgi:hypothetical protein